MHVLSSFTYLFSRIAYAQEVFQTAYGVRMQRDRLYIIWGSIFAAVVVVLSLGIIFFKKSKNNKKGKKV